MPLPPWRSLVAAALLALTFGLLGPSLAAANTKVRIEYVRLLKGGDEKTPASNVLWLVAAPSVTVSASGVSVQSAPAPAFAPDRQISGGVYVRLTAVQGAASVVVGDNPTATDASGIRVAVGQDPIYQPILAGQKVAVIEASDGAAAPPPAALAYTAVAGSPFTLSNSWTKVVTTSAATKVLSISDVTGGAYDVRWTVVVAGAAAPASGEPGQNVGFQETFAFGVPIGDVYLRSGSSAQASVYVGN